MKSTIARPLTALFSLALAGAMALSPAHAQRAVDPEVYDPNGLFDVVDTDNDGRLTLAEYSAYVNRYASLGDVTSINIRNNDGYEGVFRHYDQDRDGQLTREELGRASRINIDSTLAT